MKLVYPIFIKEEDGGYVVSIPDFAGHTQGEDMFDAMRMARDYISLQCINYEESSIEIPKSSSYDEAVQKEKRFAGKEEALDFSGGIYTLIDVDLGEYKKKMATKTVRRNVTLPSWMDYKANELNINVSRVLQEALEERFANTK